MHGDTALPQFESYLRSERRATAHTTQAYLQDIHVFEAWLSNQQIHDWCEVEAAHIMAFIRQQRRDGRAHATQVRRLASLRAFFAFMQARSLLGTDPTLGVRLARGSQAAGRTSAATVWEIAEVDALLQAPDEAQEMGLRDRAMLELLYASGMKVSELIALDCADLHTDLAYVRSTGSRGRERHIPLTAYTTAILVRYSQMRSQLAAPEETALFVNHHGRRLTRQGFWKIVKKTAAICGIDKPITPHTLRKSFAVHMLRNGADLKAVQELMGHASPSSTQSYLPAPAVRLKDIYEQTHPRAGIGMQMHNDGG